MPLISGHADTGALSDADLNKEAASLRALQARQRLGPHVLGVADQVPGSLRSLLDTGNPTAAPRPTPAIPPGEAP